MSPSESEPVFPATLSGRSLANWLRTDGQGIFTAFKSGADALRYLQSLEVNIPQSTFYSVRRQVFSLIETSNLIFGYPTDNLIPLNWHTTDHGLDIADQFSYRIHGYGTDRGTGTLRDQWYWVRSDRQLTIAEVRQNALEYVGQGFDSDTIKDIIWGEIEAMTW